MTNLDYLFAVDMAFRDVVVELAAHAIGTTNPEFAEEWLETENATWTQNTGQPE